MRFARTGRVVAAIGAVLVVFGLGRASARDKADATIVGTFGVGGVLTASGKLFQYLPDEKRWLTIDEAFKREEHDTHILPLPVPVKSIRSMESWGFLVTTDGKAWHYDLETNKWMDIGTP